MSLLLYTVDENLLLTSWKVNILTVDELTVDELTVDELTLDDLTWYHSLFLLHKLPIDNKLVYSCYLAW